MRPGGWETLDNARRRWEPYCARCASTALREQDAPDVLLQEIASYRCTLRRIMKVAVDAKGGDGFAREVAVSQIIAAADSVLQDYQSTHTEEGEP